MFWVYGFPLLMVVALGIAFRASPVEKVTVDIQAGPEAEQARDALLSQATRQGPDVRRPDQRRGNQPPAPAHRQDGPGGDRLDARTTSTVLDQSRAESRLARTAVHEALQQAAGRTDPVPTLSDEEMTRARQPLHRLSGAGPRGHGAHGRRPVGRRLRDRRHANPQTAQALRRDADAPQRTSSSPS